MSLSDLWQGIVQGTLPARTALIAAIAVGALGITLAYALVRPLVRALLRKENPKVAAPRIKRLTTAYVLAALGLGFAVFFRGTVPPEGRGDSLGVELSDLFLILFAAYALFELLLLFLCDFLPQARGRQPVAGIFKDFLRAVVLIAVAIAAVKLSFPETDIGALMTTSAILSVVVGLALQDSLSNIFAGLMLTIDRPFKPGDWIEVEGQECKVLDSNWRSTRVVTRDDDVIYVPNSTMAKSNVVNYTDPDPDHVIRRKITLDYSAPPNRVRSVLVDMMLRVEGVLEKPPPDVYVLEFGASGIDYEMWFWMADYDQRLRIESDIMRAAWYALKRAGIKIPYPIREVHLSRERAEARPEEVRALLKKVDILQPLKEEELAMLAGDLSRQLFAKGEAVCRQGEEGSTFYIIRTGSVGVSVKSPDGVEAQVAVLKPGQYFGEMSLLAGEPRSATCRALEDSELLCVGRESFEVLLQDNPAVARTMGDILEARSTETKERLASERETVIRRRAQEDTGRSRIFEKIRTIFRFKK